MRKPEGVVGWLASRQHGAVARTQLLDAGVASAWIDRRIDSGLLIALHPGVYCVGHVSDLTRCAAAVLACGPRAFLSHTTAARLRGLPVRAGDERIHVTVVGHRRHPVEGVRVHFITAIADQDTGRHEGIPIASPALTLLDLAGMRRQPMADALNEARILSIVTAADLAGVLAGHPYRPGARRLRALLARESGPKLTRSRAERLALRRMKAHGLVPDDSDVSIGPYRVDFLFRSERVIVEVDGYAYHGTRKRFVDDRRRDAELSAMGYLVVRLSWSDLHEGCGAAMSRLRRTLERRRVA